MASFEKRASGWRVRYYDASGKQRSQGGFPTKAEAKDWHAEKAAQQRAGLRVDDTLTFREFAKQYLDQHATSEARAAKLGHMIAIANNGQGRGENVTPYGFGDVALVDLTAQRIGMWAKPLSEGTRHDALAAVKQVLKAAVEWRVLPSSPAANVRNPAPKPKEFCPFEDWDQVAAIEDAIRPHYRGLATFGVGTGLRPQEWSKLRWEHIDLDARVISLPSQVAKDGRARKVPLRGRVIDALRPRVMQAALVFPNERGGTIDMHNFRRVIWAPAQEAAGIDVVRRPYDMRHTYATWALRAGLNTFSVARKMGTSLEMIDATYGHFAVDSSDHELQLLDAFDAMPQTLTVGDVLGAAR